MPYSNRLLRRIRGLRSRRENAGEFVDRVPTAADIAQAERRCLDFYDMFDFEKGTRCVFCLTNHGVMHTPQNCRDAEPLKMFTPPIGPLAYHQTCLEAIFEMEGTDKIGKIFKNILRTTRYEQRRHGYERTTPRQDNRHE